MIDQRVHVIAAVGLAGGRARGPRRVQARQDALAREAIGVGRRGRLERHRARQVAVVEHDRDVAAAADVHPVGPAGVEVLDVRLPRGEDRRRDPGLRQRGQRREVHRGLGQPHRRRPASEPHLEVAGPPQDLRPPVVRGRERQDRVVESLGDPGPAALAVGRREPREHLRRRGGEVAGERRAHVPGDVGGRPALRDRAVALLGDPSVPVAERRGRGVLGHAARERVDPAGLVEVGVDNEPAAPHRRFPGTWLTRAPAPPRPRGRARR